MVKVDDVVRSHAELICKFGYYEVEDMAVQIVWNAVGHAIKLVENGKIKSKTQFIEVVQDRVLHTLRKTLDFYCDVVKRELELHVEDEVE